MMKTANNELILFYNSNDPQDRAILGYAKSVKDHVVKEIDVQTFTFTKTQLKLISHMLDTPLEELVDKKSKTYLQNYKEANLTEEGLLTALRQNSDLLTTPIALYNDQGEVISSSYDLIKEGMFAAPNGNK